MLVSSGDIADALVDHNDFGSVLSRLEAYCNYFRSVGFGFDLPGIDQLPGRFDDAVLADDPKYFSVGKAIPKSVFASHAQIYNRINAGNALGTPPFFEAFRLSPGCEQLLWRCGDRLPHLKPQGPRLAGCLFRQWRLPSRSY